MTEQDEYQRVTSPDDPRRCQSMTAKGQCKMVGLTNTIPPKCILHGRDFNAVKEEKEKIRNYQLNKWQARLDQFSENEQVKSLREEIGILRMTLEAVVEKCNDQNDLLMNSNRIADLATRIDKVVTSCHRLESSTGQLLDRTAALNFAMQVVDIVSKQVTDPDMLETISDQILKAVGSLGKGI